MIDDITLFRSELAAASIRYAAKQHRRRRRAILITSALTSSLIASGAIAASTWLSDTPAPPDVVADFRSYTPQLDYTPNADGAVLVAQAGSVALYATTNGQGTYCVTITAPWKASSDMRDGGHCVEPAIARQPVIAGVVGVSPVSTDPTPTVVIAGRVLDRGAVEARFAAPDGSARIAPISPDGFFVATVDATLCGHSKSWAPTIAILDGDGQTLATTQITLERSPIRGVCAVDQLHGPDTP